MADKVLNTEKSAVKDKAKSEMMESMEVNPQEKEEVEANTWPGLKPKPWSVIPAKKKLVKTMMVEYIGQSVVSAFKNSKNKQKITPGNAGSTNM
ncbi:unnamed protein product [Ilex paraguariensis]|uniref:Uncharacterized protein n=1 Tax=Ilex paraguariensis TaxID=185542 RepID=A0ABC8SCN8_9AQUA